MKHFDAIDIFFILIISIYFITLFLIIFIVTAKYLFKRKNNSTKNVKKKYPICHLRKSTNYKANVSYIKNSK